MGDVDLQTRPCPEQNAICEHHDKRFDGGCIHYWRQAAFDLASERLPGDTSRIVQLAPPYRGALVFQRSISGVERDELVETLDTMIKNDGVAVVMGAQWIGAACSCTHEAGDSACDLHDDGDV